jgi:hypothetical protein
VSCNLCGEEWAMDHVENIRDLFSRLSSAERRKYAQKIATVGNLPLPESERNKMIDGIVGDCYQAVKCYAATGKTPDQIRRYKERQTLCWLLLIVLGLVMFFRWAGGSGSECSGDCGGGYNDQTEWGWGDD